MNERRGKTGIFFTISGFRYHARLEDETPTHYIIFDFKKNKPFELLKAIVATVEWEVD